MKITVWDNIQERFLELHEFSINGNGDIVLFRDGKIFDVLKSQERYVICSSIGKIDIENNDIYADSSICMLVESNSIGVFFFDEKYLRYKFAFNGDKDVSLPMNDFEKDIQFKIIGTLQQYKHLLGLDK